MAPDEMVKMAKIMEVLGLHTIEQYTQYVAQCSYDCEHSCD